MKRLGFYQSLALMTVVFACRLVSGCNGGGTVADADDDNPSSEKDITRFTILEVNGTITGTDIALTLPSGTNVTNLTPTIIHTGASVSPASGVAQDFTNPVSYTVTAEDFSTKVYTVTVTVASSSTKDITRFTILEVNGTITGTDIALTLPFGTNVTSLTPTIIHTGASVSPASGVAQDFTNPVPYTVTAADASTKVYTVTVTVVSGIKYAMWLYPYLYEPWTGHYWYAKDGYDGLGDYFEDPQIFIDYIENMEIDTIMICGGVWQGDGSIEYDTNKDETLDKYDMIALWINFIGEVKSAYPNMKVLVWVSTIGGVNTDLADTAKVQSMVSAAHTMLTETDFDGWNEDYEGWTGDLVHLKSFYYEIATMVKELGKIATVATEVNWGNYTIEDYAYLLTDFDYNMPMFYSGALHNNVTYWNQILQYSPCPVVMGISVWSSVFNTDLWEYLITFDEQIAWWTAREEENHTNLAGYCIWSFDQMSYEDMDSWEAWVASR